MSFTAQLAFTCIKLLGYVTEDQWPFYKILLSQGLWQILKYSHSHKITLRLIMLAHLNGGLVPGEGSNSSASSYIRWFYQTLSWGTYYTNKCLAKPLFNCFPNPAEMRRASRQETGQRRRKTTSSVELDRIQTHQPAEESSRTCQAEGEYGLQKNLLYVTSNTFAKNHIIIHICNPHTCQHARFMF